MTHVTKTTAEPVHLLHFPISDPSRIFPCALSDPYCGMPIALPRVVTRYRGLTVFGSQFWSAEPHSSSAHSKWLGFLEPDGKEIKSLMPWSGKNGDSLEP